LGVTVHTNNEHVPRLEPPPTVFVIHNDVSVRVTMNWISRVAGFGFTVCAGASELFDYRRDHVPSCLILDAALWDVHAIQLGTLLSARSETPVIFVAERGDVLTAVKAMKAGAVEFLMKPISESAMFMAVQSAMDRSRAAVALARDLQLLGGRYSSLTRRQRQVMICIVAGFMNKHVAEHLGISIITAKVHRHHVMKKMRAASLADLVRMAAKLRLSHYILEPQLPSSLSAHLDHRGAQLIGESRNGGPHSSSWAASH
jgi:FixJ family two-component response regulator